MPDLFPSVSVFVASALVVAAAQLIYASVGFGAGLFSVAILAMILPDLAGAVATLFLLILVTEVTVLLHAWRHARVRLLLGLLPTTAVGTWLGTELLVGADVAALKRLLGVVVMGAGAWFLYSEGSLHSVPGGEGAASAGEARSVGAPSIWASLPTGLLAGMLGGLFGTGGPPVIILLKTYRLGKSAFRSNLLWYFFLMSLIRGTAYLQAGVLTKRELTAAACLLPASVAGALLGMVVHRRIEEERFAMAVSVLLVLLGGLLAVGGGR